MTAILSLNDSDIDHKRLLIREDFNVPMQEGKISDTSRIDRALPTLRYALKNNSAIMICSHLGRPVEGTYDPAYSLEPVAACLAEKLNHPVGFEKDWINGLTIEPGEVILCENVRFNPGESINDPALAKKMAALCDVFVMDAFASAHRSHASTVGVAEYAAVACAGPLLLEELNALSTALQNPEPPLVAVVGGAKVSTKLQLLEAMLDQVETLVVGGGMANTLLAASGYSIGQSLYEKDMLDFSRQLINTARAKNVSIPLPVDVCVATEFSKAAKAKVCCLEDIQANEMILDVGPKTQASYERIMQQAGTIIWNGPVGVFEFPAFANGTKSLGEAIGNSSAFSLAGGGDTVAACNQFNLNADISYISTGGGAFLETIQGLTLPAVTILEKKASHYA